MQKNLGANQMKNEQAVVCNSDVLYWATMIVIIMLLPLVFIGYTLADFGGVHSRSYVTSRKEVIRKEIVTDKEAEESKVTKVENRIEKHEVVKEEVVTEDVGICIDENIFDKTQVRLNTDIYDLSGEVFSVDHVKGEYGESGTKLYNSFLENMDPLIPEAMTLCETHMWGDSRYTWCSAVYTGLLAKKNVNMSRLVVDRVNVDTYVVNGLCSYLGCGTNCTGDKAKHYHTIGNNDNDSLGPLQILRHYVEGPGVIEYQCGETTSDLMNWRDNLEWFTHAQADTYSNPNHWNKDYEIGSTYELVALMGVGHNTGLAFQQGSSTGSLWKNSKAVYEFCNELGKDETIEVFNEYVDEWYEYAISQQKKGESFSPAGPWLSNRFSEILTKAGIEKGKYANGWNHKQWYPMKAVLNYMGLERLYYSGKGDQHAEAEEN